MKKIFNRFYMLLMPVLLLSACEKEGTFPPKVKTIRALTSNGFSLTRLDQYFDGVKVRELYAGVTGTSDIGFSTKEVTMELRRQSDGKTLYRQKFDSSDATHEIPMFYFDGNEVLPRYEYPDPVGKAYTANFYFDFPKDSGAVDVTAEMIEYYLDFNLPELFVYLDTISVPLAKNVQPGKWSGYFTLEPLPSLPRHHPESDFMTNICIKKAGKNEFYNTNVMDVNLLNMQLPTMYTTEGSVQSIFVGFKQLGGRAVLEPQQDLTRLFPK